MLPRPSIKRHQINSVKLLSLEIGRGLLFPFTGHRQPGRERRVFCLNTATLFRNGCSRRLTFSSYCRQSYMQSQCYYWLNGQTPSTGCRVWTAKIWKRITKCNIWGMGQDEKKKQHRWEHVRVESMRSKYNSTGIVGLSFLSLSLSPVPEESLSTVKQQLALSLAVSTDSWHSGWPVNRHKQHKIASKTITGQH